MFTTSIVVLLLAIPAIRSLPIANDHVTFLPSSDFGARNTRIQAQNAFVRFRRNRAVDPAEFGQRIPEADLHHPNRRVASIKPQNPESLWPLGVFIPPVDINDLGYSKQDSNRITQEYPYSYERDPYLLMGEAAAMAVKYIYGHGELFYEEIPHVRALLQNQEERRLNGLHDHVLSSARPSSPFYRKIKK